MSEARPEEKPALPPDLTEEPSTVVRPRESPALEPEGVDEESAARGADAPRQPAPGSTLAARYTVLDALGHGGMGVVLAAYDARLDRRVALKLLRSRERGGDTEGKARMVREAQAMARLSHSHVVGVYDAGTLEDGSVFIAMEYVEGQTLRRWRHQRERSWREVLAAYVAAGRGLAAAHAAGIIHRDFKPDNVLVGKEGRVRVTDFGLARAEHAAAGTLGAAAVSSPTGAPLSAEALNTPLTVPGTVMGTPMYMAPEVLRGRPADVRSDVYAFSVALYEALYGQLPYEGGSLVELLQAQREGKVKPAPESTKVPAWVWRTVVKGLQADAARRPASLEEMLGALETDPEARRLERVRAISMVAGVGLLVAVAAVGWLRQQEPGCSQQERGLVGVWDEAVKKKVKQALEGTGVPFAPDTFVRLSGVLDGYAGEWVKQRGEVCVAMRGQEAQPRSLTVRREYCLERRRGQLLALTELLSREPDKDLVSKAVQMAQALPLLEYCADAQALTAAVPPPEDPAVKARVQVLQAQVDRLEALLAASRYTEGLALGEQLLRQVEPVGHAPLQAQVLFLVASLSEGAGDYTRAEERMRQALPLAARGKALPLLAQAWSHLVVLVGDQQGRLQEAEHLAPAAEVAVELAEDDRARADWLNNQGNVLSMAGKYEEAREKYERALVLREKVLGPGHPDVAYSLDTLGNALRSLGRHEEARQAQERALALREKALGPENLYVAYSLNNLGNDLLALGRYEAAREKYERALGLLEKALGPEHPSVAVSRCNVGLVLFGLGRQLEAKETYERSLELLEKTLGPEHPSSAYCLGLLGNVLSDLGRYAEAEEKCERSLGRLEKALGPEHPFVAASLDHLGSVLSELGRYAEAKEKYGRARALREKVLGPEHPNVADSFEGMGRVLTELGRYEEARENYERALTLKEKKQGPRHPELAHTLLGLGKLHRLRGQPAEAVPLLERALTLDQGLWRMDIQVELAQALWSADQDRPRAVQLATEAREHWNRLGNQPRFTRASQWLATHASP